MTASDMTASGMTMIRGRVVTPDGVLEDALVRVEAGRIVAVGTGGDADLTAAWIVPGFVDLHVHGGGGHTFTSGDPDEARAAAAFHARHGTTTLQASLVTASPAATRAAVEGLAPLVHDGLLAGVHLEGPYLSTARCGAQNPAYLRDPDPDELAELLSFGAVRTVTIAPELPGALTAIRQLRVHGVIAAIGHTDATYEQTLAAVDAGATLATHLANAMRPIHQRDPGPIVALLDAEAVVCEQIADGVHLHDGMLAHVVRVAGSDRVALITDAIAATGMTDGDYELGGQRVTVEHGVARLASNRTIAGSTLTMDAALRRAVHSGISIVDAVRMASTTPARVLGRSDEIGAIAEGLRADLVLLDESLHVIAVTRIGEVSRAG
jgi:N-acetylglucosamine-6-phosphate deacetylase